MVAEPCEHFPREGRHSQGGCPGLPRSTILPLWNLCQVLCASWSTHGGRWLWHSMSCFQ